ncbi:MAG: DUF1015 domain-containing protein, partial [Candidatus Aureabacteria bacterium]|nr:DUF1015 domain-containing protein [Candidatus Auribacterota bacterium]
MANIIPFRGLKYNREKVSISDVVSFPYDKLDKDLLKLFSSKSPYNIAELIKGDYLREDTSDSWYAHVRDTVNRWIKEGILVYSENPSLYIYEQVFSKNGKDFSRFSFTGLGELQPFQYGHIKPHENTFFGPKQDRSRLLEATHMNFGHIFVLFYGKENSIRDMVTKVAAALSPECNFKDDFGVRHRFWEVSDKTFITKIISQMKDQQLLIADGHHRYESALELYEKMKKDHPGEAEKFRYRMMTFVDINDPSLVILPTHRVFYPDKKISQDKSVLLEKLEKNFDVSDSFQKTDARSLDDILQSASYERPFFLMVKGNTVKSLTMKKESFASIGEIIKRLSVSVLQDIIARNILHLDFRSMVPGKDVNYFKNTEDVLEDVRKNPQAIGFLVKPTPIDQVRSVVEVSGRMPQKSTDFYPKIYTGFVFYKM